MKQKTYIGIVVSFVMAIIFGMEVYASSHETISVPLKLGRS